jgi:hypothetical protein
MIQWLPSLAQSSGQSRTELPSHDSLMRIENSGDRALPMRGRSAFGSLFEKGLIPPAREAEPREQCVPLAGAWERGF